MSNVELSSKEYAVIENADFLLTKNAAIQKLQKAFGEIADTYRKITESGMDVWQLHCNTHPKIAKGEQYEGLPYLMLDYPRSFSDTDTFAVRSFFWWGNYFSISLLLTGKSQERLVPQLLTNPILADWHVDTAATPWQHNWKEETSPKLALLSQQNYVPKDFFKLSKQMPLSKWQDMEQFFVSSFRQLWTAVNFPNV